mgnify:CR=1 FL=1
MLRVADGVAGFPLHLADGHDVAAAGFLDLGVLLAAHGVHAAELIGAAHAHVAQRQIGRDLAGEHLDEGVLAELVGNGLEHERAHRTVRVDGELAAVRRGDLTDVGRAGHVIDDRPQHALGADAAAGSAAEHGEHGAVLQTLTQALDGVLLGEHHVLEVFLHEFLVRTGGRLKERLAQRLDHVGVGGGNGDLRGLVAIGLVSHVVHQIDDTGAVAHRRGHGADGAAVLVALNELYQTGLDTRKLQEIGALVGADVPFCISGGCALAEGIGEILSPIHAHPEYCLVICKPEVGVSTAAAYKKFDEIGTICPPMTDSLIASLIAGDMKEAALYMSNAFEQLLNLPEVTEIETLLTKHGALKAVMSGSGSAVFGIFDSPLKAEKCFLECKPQYPETYLCHPYNKGATVL